MPVNQHEKIDLKVEKKFPLGKKSYKRHDIYLLKNKTKVGDDVVYDSRPNMLNAMSSPYGSPIGKNNCVELVLSAAAQPALGGLLGGMMGAQSGSNSSARTYYAYASSHAEAEEWRKAIQNNIDVS